MVKQIKNDIITIVIDLVQNTFKVHIFTAIKWHHFFSDHVCGTSILVQR